MTPHAGIHGAYSAATQATGTPRDIEYAIFSRVTGELNRAIADDRPFPELAAAVHENFKLWTALAADLTSERNALPPALRAQLIGLAQFTRRQSHAVLRGEAEPGVLVEINTAIMKGLRGQLPPEPGTAALDAAPGEAA